MRHYQPSKRHPYVIVVVIAALCGLTVLANAAKELYRAAYADGWSGATAQRKEALFESGYWPDVYRRRQEGKGWKLGIR